MKNRGDLFPRESRKTADRAENCWYKLDQFGYEALAETAVSALLEKNIETGLPFSFVRYRMERLHVHGWDRTGCVVKIFLGRASR